MPPTLESLGIDRLDVAERILLAEAIWDSVSSPEFLRLQSEIAVLTGEVAALKTACPAELVPVQTFAPEPYDLLKPLSVTVQADEDEFSACFPDANLTAVGDNEFEAVEHLKAMILDTFDKFSSGRRLGPGPTKQLAVLREFIGKRV